ncbi:MAG: ABC transporter substrate-binding protein [Spirochaetales bacterium]|nr:ABC transporter substrate-binding protein [Spirochaetales bacterium]
MKKQWALVLFLLMTASSLVLAGGKSEAAEEDLSKQVLIVGSVDSVTTWDPSASYSTEIAYFTNLYEGLIRAAAPGSDQPFEPLLATAWEASPDGLEWTFTLRRGVTFHDGTAFNAQAVKYSYERTMELGLGAAFILDPIESITVVDDYTVLFKLSYAAPLDRIAASAYGSWIFSPAVKDKGREWFEEGNAAGTGPYKLESYKPDQEIVLVRNENYWGPKDTPAVQRVLVRIVKDAVTMQNMLEAGQADIVTLIPKESLSSVDDRDDCKVLTGPSFMNYAIHLNTQKPPLDNVLVRRAISYAIPYDDVITVSLGDLGTKAVSPIPFGQFGCATDLPQYTTDLAKARDLMKQAGFAGGIDRTLVFTFAAENAAHQAYAPLIKESLEKIGIPVEVRPILWTAQWEMMKGDPLQAQDLGALLWWPTFNDPYETLASLWRTEKKPFFNFAYYSNPRYDDLIDRAYATPDEDEALKLYRAAQEILVQEAPSVYLFDLTTAVPMRENIQGFVINPAYPKAMYFYGVKKN